MQKGNKFQFSGLQGAGFFFFFPRKNIILFVRKNILQYTGVLFFEACSYLPLNNFFFHNKIYYRINTNYSIVHYIV